MHVPHFTSNNSWQYWESKLKFFKIFEFLFFIAIEISSVVSFVDVNKERKQQMGRAVSMYYYLLVSVF